jgi:lipopolysaccharide transport system ATP-binding protein
MQYLYRYSVEFTESVRNVRFGMLIKTLTGLELGGALSHPTGEHIKYVDKSLTINVEFMFSCLLTPGVFFECWRSRFY